MICLAQCLGSFLFGAVLASIATSLFLAARQDFGGKNRPAHSTSGARSITKALGPAFWVTPEASGYPLRQSLALGLFSWASLWSLLN
jgi:hypothetical protein